MTKSELTNKHIDADTMQPGDQFAFLNHTKISIQYAISVLECLPKIKSVQSKIKELKNLIHEQ